MGYFRIISDCRSTIFYVVYWRRSNYDMGEVEGEMINDNHKLEVIVVDDVPMFAVKIYLIDKRYKPMVGRLKDGFLEWDELKEGEETQATMRINRDVWKAMKESMIDNHERDKSVVESELKATNRHLEDMRTLVFRKKL